MKLLPAIAILSLSLTAALAQASAVSPQPSTSRTNAIGTELISSNAVPVSVFVIPKNQQQGRDPFFPASTRLTVLNQSTNSSSDSVEIYVPLTLQGISGLANRRLAIINGRTLAENEEADIPTGSSRVRVRVIEIKTDSVIIQTSNTRRELRLRSGN
jgi:hypothetical protein